MRPINTQTAHLDLPARVRGTISRYSMFAPGARIGVAVSGGADSVALLHVLHELAPHWNLRLHVLHLNHALRGPASDQDQEFVRGLAASLDLPIETAALAPGELRGNIEQAARRMRRKFFQDAAQRLKLQSTATGHTLDDQAETVLFRILRGTAIAGLTGILPVTAEGIVRPLLDCRRTELCGWLQARGIGWREDASNTDPSFARNRIRHQLLPQLTADWNPNLAEALHRLGALARQDEAYWAPYLESLGLLRAGEQEVFLDVRGFRKLPEAVQGRLLRQAVSELRMDCSELTHAHFQALLRLARSSAGSGRASLPGLTAIRSFHTLRLAPPPALADGFCIPLVPPQSVPLHPAGTRLVIEGVCARADSGYNEDDSYLSLDRLSGPLLLRSWRPGDVFQPRGAPAPVRVKDLFQEARTPLWDRPFWPMISQGETIVWMRGYGSAERFAPAAGAPGAWRVYETVEEIPSR